MPRSLRILHPGAWHHVTARGIERRPIFRDNRDRSHFVELLQELAERFRLRLHAYVLMENHYHLLIELGQPNLSRAIQWLNVSYSVWFNRRHQRSGYLFQGRFKSIVVDPRGWDLALSAYIHLNPVRVARLGLGKSDRQRARAGAGQLPEHELVRKRIESLRDYRWSSYRAYIGLDRCPPWLESATVLEQGGGAKNQRTGNYRKYVENQIREGLAQKPWEELRDQIVLGGAQFAKTLKQAARKQKPTKGLEQWLREPIKLEQVIAAVEEIRGEPWPQLKDRHGDPGRDLALWLARKTTGLTVAVLAKKFGLKQGANVSMSVKRYQKRIEDDKKERSIATRAAQQLAEKE